MNKRPIGAIVRVLIFVCATSVAHAGPRLDELRAKAEKGDSEAQFQLGLTLANDPGNPKDDKEAAIWLSKAAEQGNLEAQVVLGTFVTFQPSAIQTAGRKC